MSMCEHMSNSGVEKLNMLSEKSSLTTTESSKPKVHNGTLQEKSHKQRSSVQCLQCLAEKMNQTGIADLQHADAASATDSHSDHEVEKIEKNEHAEDSANNGEPSFLKKNESSEEAGEKQPTESSGEEEAKENNTVIVTVVKYRQRALRLQNKAVQTEQRHQQRYVLVTDDSDDQSEREATDAASSSIRRSRSKSISKNREHVAKQVAYAKEHKQVHIADRPSLRFDDVEDDEAHDESERSEEERMPATPKRSSRLRSLSKSATKTPKNAARAESNESTPTSKKFDSFIKQPIGELSVFDLPGVGKNFGQVLLDKGYEDAESVLTVFLELKRSEHSYSQWMIEQGCKQINRAEECAQALGAWCRLHLHDPEPLPLKRKVRSMP